MKRLVLSLVIVACFSTSAQSMQALRQLNTRVGPTQTGKLFSQLSATLGTFVFGMIAVAITQSTALDPYITHQTCAPLNPSECKVLIPELRSLMQRLNASDVSTLNTMFNHTNARSASAYTSVIESLCANSPLPSWCYELDATLKWRLTFWTPMAASIVGWVLSYFVGMGIFKCAIQPRLESSYEVL